VPAGSLADVLRERAAGQPERRAYTFLVDGEAEEVHLTYGGLDLQARAVAAHLQSLGLHGERALLVYPSGLEYLAGFFGCLYAGAVAVPAYPPRLNRSLARLRTIVQDARVAVALTTADLLEGLAPRLAAAPELGALPWVATDALGTAEAGGWRHPNAGPDTLAFLQYTSGSTTAPKGVMVTHGNLLHNQALIRRAFPQPEDALLVGWLPPYHDMGLIGQILQPLYAGFPGVLLSPTAFLQKPARWLQAMSRYRGTGGGGPNFGYELCVEKVTPEQRQGLDLSRWSVAFNGAEPIRPGTLERFAATFAEHGFRREAFYPCYGLAEATLIVSGAKGIASVPTIRPFQVRELEQGRAVPVSEEEAGGRTLAGSGLALAEQRIAVVDPGSLAELPAGRVGEVWVSGGSVARGYWGREEETASTFRARLADGEGPFLRTGDLGFLLDGELFVTGRGKDLVILRGRNHYPQDLEWTVERSHPDLLAGGSAAFSIDAGGEERLVVVQEVHRHSLRRLDPAQVAAAVRTAVAAEHDVEIHAVALVRPFSLPKTSSGKIQRHLCRAAFLEGSLERVGEWREPAAPGTSFSLSRDMGERGDGIRIGTIRAWLVEKLAAQLRVDPASLDTGAPFVQHGLDSARLVGLSGDLEAWLGRRLDPTLLYEHPTIEALARHLAGGEGERAREDGRPAGRPPTSFAIVGMACRFPGADGVEAFWELLRGGVDAVTEVPAERRELTGWPAAAGVRWGGFLTGVERFDPAFFGLGRREAERVDPQQRLLLEVAWEALEDSGQTRERLAGSRTGVFVGISTYDYGRLQPGGPGSIEAYDGTGCALSIAANRLSYTFDLRGPSLAVDTACSSSLVALHLACRGLEEGECGLALVGGVNLMLAPDVGVSYARAGNLAADGRCKAFDARADGFVRGEGAGCAVLKPLARALADGDRIYAVVRGTAVNQDGRTNGLMAPSPQAQEEVLREAWNRAGASPADARYVEAHGTGTLLGDPIEARALGRVLAPGRPPGSRCAVGSVKTNLGHLEAAAGMAGLIKTALALHHREIPPSLHFEEPNPHIPFGELPLEVQRELRPLPAAGPVLAGVSAFGFGGTNAHAVLASAPEPVRMPVERPAPHLVPLSAHTPEALAARARSLLKAGITDIADIADLADIAYTAGARRTHHAHRLAVVARDGGELRAGLETFLRGEEHPSLARGRVRQNLSGPVFVLGGQGPQRQGMGRELAAQEPVFRAALEECDRLVVGDTGWSLIAELEAPEERSRLGETEIAQPALFALQVALAALWRHWGVEPGAVIGHSSGEVVAAYLAGVLSLEQAAHVAVERGRLLRRAAAGGRMAQIGLAAEEAARELAGLEDRLAIAAVNDPRSVVVSGDPEALEELAARLEPRRVDCRFLSVGYAFHSPRIEPFLEAFESAVGGLTPRPAVVPLASTLTGTLSGGEDWGPGYWRRQVRQPVLFGAAALALIAQGHRRFLEIGPHPVLPAALSECFRHAGAEGMVLASLRRGEPERLIMLRSLAALYAQGQGVAWRSLHERGGRPVALPAYPWERERCWLEEAGPARRPAGGGHPPHPLLGQPVALAHPRHQWVWESDLELRHLPFLEDHRVEGAVVLPATVYLEMALSAGAQAAGEPPAALVDVRFRSPLVVSEGSDTGARRLQFVLTPEGESGAAFRIFSRPAGDDLSGAAWTLHATGRILHETGDGHALEPVDLAAVRGRCPDALAGADYYPRLAAQGLQYGPRFQGIERLWQGAGEALAEVGMPPGLAPGLEDYRLHPAILDACGQVLAAAANGHGGIGGVGRPFLPAGIDELRVHGRPGPRLWSHAWRRAEDGPAASAASLVGDGRLIDPEGRVVVEARGMRLQVLDAEVRGAGRPAPADWLYELRWEPIELPEPVTADGLDDGLAGGWLVLAHPEGTGEALAARLAGLGGRCALAFPGAARETLSEARFQIRPGAAEDVSWLLDSLLADGWPPLRGVVHLWGPGAVSSGGPGETTTASLAEAELHGCGAAIALVRELVLRAEAAPPRLWLVTRGAQPLGGAPVAVAQSPLWGFGRSLAQEHPALWGGLIDLDPGEGAAAGAERVVRQLRAPGGEVQVAWRGGVPHGARLARRRDLLRGTAAPRWRVDGSYLVTGGFGGLGLEVARWMVSEGVRRLILLGRTQLPPRSTWSGIDPASRAGRQVAAVRELEAGGAAVHLAPVDVADEAQMAAFLEGYRNEGWPPIRGVVHAAGVLQDQAVLQLDAAALAAVFRAKVLGGWLLHRLLEREPLDFFVLFSSAAALLGSAGQAHYAAANAFLDALAHLRRAAGKPASSLAWGPWAEIGMAAQGGESLERRGLGSIRPEEGLELLGRLLARDPVHAGIVLVDWERLFDAFPSYRGAALLCDVAGEQGRPDAATAAGADAGAAAVLAALRAAGPAERLADLQALLAGQVARVVGLPPSRLDPHVPLSSLGVDSLMAAELKARLERDLGMNLPIVRLLESPSLAELAGVLLDQVGGSEPAAAGPGDAVARRPLRVALQPGGSRLPFFCMHPGALEVQCYEPLVRALGPEQPFYALQPAELDNYRLEARLDTVSEGAPAGSLEDAAARCVEALREIRPSGPYLLGGWSMGGVLAWEVGRRLVAEGEEVARLVLLDSPAPPSSGEAPDDYDDDRLLPVFARYLGARRGRSLALAGRDGRAGRLRDLLRAGIEAGAVPADFDEGQLLALLHVFKAGLLRSVRQLWTCRPEAGGAVSFPVTLLRPHQVLDAFADLFPDPAARWAELTSAGLETRRVPGDHYTLFLPDHAQELARELERSLALAA
jgi:acyl transferase domain-containing protein/acyl-CoA synthetase (AMP-forming)/AMP-acid ligase II/thioesterase domain-containing protein/acyl carrier protein